MQFPPASGKTRSKELLIKLPIRKKSDKGALSVKRDVIFLGPLNACSSSTVCFGAGSSMLWSKQTFFFLILTPSMERNYELYFKMC